MAYSSESDDTIALLDRIADGDPTALERLLRLHRPYLKRIVQVRMEPALKARVDESDVVQEAQIVITRNINHFIKHRSTSFRIWIRRKVLDQLIEQQRRHIGAEKRSIVKEQHVSSFSSMAIARTLLSETASKVMQRNEFAEKIRELIESLNDNDREILTLRHAEGLTNSEIAEALGIEVATVRKRYGRALYRFAEKATAAELEANLSWGDT